MNVLNKIRGAIAKVLQKSSLVLRIVVKFILFYLLFRYLTSLDVFTGTGIFNSTQIQLVLALVSALLPNRAGVLIGICIIIYNVFQTSVIGGVIYGLMLLLAYVVTVNLFPDQAFLLVLVPVFIEWKMYLAVPLFAGLYMGVISVVPVALGVVMYGMIGIMPAFIGLENSGALDELPQLISGAAQSGITSLTSNEQLKYIMIVSAGTALVISILRMMRFNYSRYIAIGLSGVAGIVCLMMCVGRGYIEGPSGTVLLRAILTVAVLAFIEFLHVSANYKEARSLEFEDDEYLYQVRMIPKLGVSFGSLKKAPSQEIMEKLRENRDKKGRGAASAKVSPEERARAAEKARKSAEAGSKTDSQDENLGDELQVSDRKYELTGAKVSSHHFASGGQKDGSYSRRSSYRSSSSRKAAPASSPSPLEPSAKKDTADDTIKAVTDDTIRAAGTDDTIRAPEKAGTSEMSAQADADTEETASVLPVPEAEEETAEDSTAAVSEETRKVPSPDTTTRKASPIAGSGATEDDASDIFGDEG